ncbi:MAG: hypothetical protein HY791_24290 [Deltaproteobacteria bacterium]|nr:hypothetical protein [Deltaproteobacteria bacterium]
MSHARVLPQTSVLVTHCGHGTVVKGPMVCIPMGRDQNEKVTYLGAGVKLKPSASVERLRASISRVLEVGTYREAAARVARAIASREGDEDVVEVIASLTSRADPLRASA